MTSRAAKAGWAAGLTAAATAATLTYAVRGRSSSLFGPSVWRGPNTRRAIALTFDDGPSESTPYILDLLREYHARATFFQCGRNAERLPAIAEAVRAEGHETGNHSYSHSPMYLRSPGFIYQDFARAQEILGPVPLMRAPFGARWVGFSAMQRRLGLLGVMWSVIGRDWTLPWQGVFGRVVHQARPGAIVCLHDARELTPNPDIGNTIQALRGILAVLSEGRYQFETVSQILCPKT